MVTTNESTIVCENTLGYAANIIFRSAKSRREFNSIYIPNGIKETHDLEYYIYPADCYITTHYVKDNEYVSQPLTTLSNNEYCVINDIGHDEKQIFSLIDTLSSKYNKTVHYNNKKDSAFSYRLSRVFDIFPACKDALSAYFLIDYFYDLNKPKVIKIR